MTEENLKEEVGTNVDPEDITGVDTDTMDDGDDLTNATDLPAFMSLSRDDVKELSDEEKLVYLTEATKHMMAYALDFIDNADAFAARHVGAAAFRARKAALHFRHGVTPFRLLTISCRDLKKNMKEEYLAERTAKAAAAAEAKAAAEKEAANTPATAPAPEPAPEAPKEEKKNNRKPPKK